MVSNTVSARWWGENPNCATPTLHCALRRSWVADVARPERRLRLLRLPRWRCSGTMRVATSPARMAWVMTWSTSQHITGSSQVHRWVSLSRSAAGLVESTVPRPLIALDAAGDTDTTAGVLAVGASSCGLTSACSACASNSAHGRRKRLWCGGGVGAAASTKQVRPKLSEDVTVSLATARPGDGGVQEAMG